MTPEKRQRFQLRLDGGFGTAENINCALQRGYHLLAKVYSTKRAQKLAKSVTAWVNVPSQAGLTQRQAIGSLPLIRIAEIPCKWPKNADEKGRMLQKHIAEVYKTIRDLHKETALQKETTRLRLKEGVDVFYIVELFAADVAGYAQSVMRGWRRESPEAPLKSLREISIFENHEFWEWYSQESNTYPNFINYVKMNDYLRLLVIEYLLSLNHFPKQKTEGAD